MIIRPEQVILLLQNVLYGIVTWFHCEFLSLWFSCNYNPKLPQKFFLFQILHESQYLLKVLPEVVIDESRPKSTRHRTDVSREKTCKIKTRTTQ